MMMMLMRLLQLVLLCLSLSRFRRRLFVALVFVVFVFDFVVAITRTLERLDLAPQRLRHSRRSRSRLITTPIRKHEHVAGVAPAQDRRLVGDQKARRLQQPRQVAPHLLGQ